MWALLFQFLIGKKKTIDYKHVDTAESVGIQPIDYDYIRCKKERKT
jgi:hypothetical protein